MQIFKLTKSTKPKGDIYYDLGTILADDSELGNDYGY